MYSFGSLIPTLGVAINMLSIVNVLEDLYGLMDDVSDKAEEDGLQQSSLREMHR